MKAAGLALQVTLSPPACLQLLPVRPYILIGLTLLVSLLPRSHLTLHAYLFPALLAPLANGAERGRKERFPSV